MPTSSTKRLVLITLVVLGIIILHYTNILRPVEHGIIRVTSPVVRFVSNAGRRVANVGVYFQQKKELSQKIEMLKKQLIAHQIDTVQRTILEEENKELRKQLIFARESGITTTAAFVVGKTIDNTANTIIIDKGSDDNISKGKPVITKDGIIIGKIAKVAPKTAIVRLINDPQSKVAATVLNQDKSIGIIESRFGTGLKLTTVLQTETLNPEDLIITSGLEEFMPRGLLIGTVLSVKKEDYAPFQEAIIEPATDLSRLTIVGVIQ